jgi:CHAT domain-containing protein
MRRKVLGEEHPDIATTLNWVADNLAKRTKYAEAERLQRQGLAIRRKALGEAHPHTALGYNSLALNLDGQGRYAEAEPLHRKALAIRQQVLGEEHPDTARSYNSVALNLDEQGQYTEAERFGRKALTIRQKVLGEKHPDTATSYNNVAASLTAQGQYAAAELLLRTALAIRQEVLGEQHPDTALGYDNLAVNLDAQGKYAAAEPLTRKALAIRRQVLGEDHPATAASYDNLASNLDAQGQYAAAEPLKRKALAIRLKVLGENHPDTATSCNNLAYNLNAQGRYAEAERLYRRALAISRRVLGDDHPATAASYDNLGFNLDDQGKHAAAEPLKRKALAIRQKALGEAHPATATSYNNLAFNLEAQGNFAEAEPLHRKALAICQKALGEAHRDTAISYTTLADNLNAQGKYREAEKLWRAAALGFEAARLGISFTGLERVTFTTEHSPLPRLAACLARADEAPAAWAYWEASLARGLFDDLSARLARPLSDKERHREQDLLGRMQLLDKQITVLVQPRDVTDANRQQLAKLQGQRDAVQVELTQFEAELAQKYGPVAGRVYELPAIQKQLPADAALVGWLDLKGQPKSADPSGEHWACIVRKRGRPAWVKIPGSGAKAAWTEADVQLPEQVRRCFEQPPAEVGAKWRESAARLYQQRLAPLAEQLGATPELPAVRHLIVLPSSALAGVPMEALVAARSDRQPAYTVSYAPSGTMFAWLQEQRQTAPGRPPRPPRLLALGDPVFARPGGTAPAPAPLPGSRREVEAIARLFEQADTLLGSRASEQQLDTLAASGRLKEYAYLHLATHGVLDPQVTMHSALLLAQDALPDPLQQVLAGHKAYDGRLTAAQILRTWQLDAELVTLSACQTGLGQRQGGEGYLGFAQALFLAGGRSLVVSQWKVDDGATALLMTRFYQNLLGKRPGLDQPLPKAEALHEAKRWLRGLPAEEVQKLVAALPEGARGTERVRAPAAGSAKPYGHPYYWAAFILIGDPR